ncbi:hypothetical protein ACUN9Y_04365 [Halomonas sp. V046]|uniref:hypothetical protein n=1 Tax=Halomonas sp. V046 TaxID=3459611 RepID=UPI004043B32C
MRHGVLYCNDGDWVEHCTALIERPNGQLALIDWQGRVIEEEPVMVPHGAGVLAGA